MAQKGALSLRAMHLTFIYGPPASGKLTVARIVAQRTGHALFHHHLVMDALLAVFPFASPEFIALRERFWLETIAAAARGGRSLIFTFCPESTVDTAFPARVRSVVEQAGGSVCFIRLTVTGEEQERRIVSPTRAGTKLKRVAILRRFAADFDAALSAMPAPALTIDTTLESPQTAAKRIIEHACRSGERIAPGASDGR